eukprot:4869995-Pyramimonas_sp.AAC.1
MSAPRRPKPPETVQEGSGTAQEGPDIVGKTSKRPPRGPPDVSSAIWSQVIFGPCVHLDKA